MNISSDDKFLRMTDICGRIGLGKSTIYRQIAAGDFPQGHSVLGRYRVWLERDVSAWMAEQLNSDG